MQPTRQHILDYLRVHRDASVREFGTLLGLTATGVRQHLAVLEQEGLIQSREERGRIGRPALRYALTLQGEESYPRQYHQLACALLEEAAAVCGEENLHKVALGVARRLGAPLDLAPGATSEERVERLVGTLRSHGVVVDWAREGEVILLMERTCPYPQVARQTPLACAIDTEQISTMSGMHAELTQCITSGADCCVFRLLPVTPVEA